MSGKGKNQGQQNAYGWNDGGKSASRPKDSDDQISKMLAVTLRYYRNHNGLNADANGYIRVSDIVKFQGKGGETFSEDDVLRVAETSISKNSGKRFDVHYERSLQAYVVRAAYDHAERYPAKGTGKSKGKGKGKGKDKDNHSQKGGYQRWNGQPHRQVEEDTSNPFRAERRSDALKDQSWDTGTTSQPEARSRAESYGNQSWDTSRASQPEMQSSGPSRQPTALPAASQQRSSGSASGAHVEQEPWVPYSQAADSMASTRAEAQGDRRTLPHTAGASQSAPYDIEDEYEALDKHGLHNLSQTSASPAATTLEASKWQQMLGDGRDLNRSEQQAEAVGQDQSAETAPPSGGEWTEYVAPETERRWYHNDTTDEYFFEDEAEWYGWKKYTDDAGKAWWWHETSERHFYPKASVQ